MKRLWCNGCGDWTTFDPVWAAAEVDVCDVCNTDDVEEKEDDGDDSSE